MSNLYDVKDAMSSSSSDTGHGPRRNEVLSRETDDGSFELILDSGEMRSISPAEDLAPPPDGEEAAGRRSRWLYVGAAALALVLIGGVAVAVFGGRDGAVGDLTEDLPVVPGFKPYAGAGAPQGEEGGARRGRRPAAAPEGAVDEEIEVDEEAEAWAIEEGAPEELEAPRLEPEAVVPVEAEIIEEEAEVAEEEPYEEDYGEELPEPALAEDYAEDEEYLDDEPVDDGYDIKIQRPDLQHLRRRQGSLPGLRNAAEPILGRGVGDLPGSKLGPALRRGQQAPGDEEGEYYDEEALPPEDEFYEDEQHLEDEEYPEDLEDY